LLTTSRELYERGLTGRDEPLHFATWGEPAFESLLEHVVQSMDEPVGARRIQALAGEKDSNVIKWIVSSDSGATLVTQYDHLIAVKPEQPINDSQSLPGLSHVAHLEEQEMAKFRSTEKASAIAASIHHKTHLLVAAKLMAAAPRDATLADLGAYLPDGSRTLRSGRLESMEVQAERLHGILQGTDKAVFLPKFYQPYLVNTLKKERLALKKARKGTDEDQIPLGELADRLMRAAQSVGSGQT
jgi:hypothetical protein